MTTPVVVEMDPEIPVIVRDYSSESKHYVYPLGDVHIGAKTYNEALWLKWLGYLGKKPNASLLGTGDFLNTAIIGSKSDIYDETGTVGQSKRKLKKQLYPLRERIDAICPGNHENRVTRLVGDCPIEDISDHLGCPYFRAAALLIYRVGVQEYHLYIRHGTGNGQSLAGLAKGGQVIHADIYVTGHTHKQSMTTDDYFVVVDGKVVRKRRHFLSSGSFMGYENYAAERGYAPSRLGAPKIELDGNAFDVRVSI